jgi:hypothetical protein
MKVYFNILNECSSLMLEQSFISESHISNLSAKGVSW